MSLEKARKTVGYRTVDIFQFHILFEEKLAEPQPAKLSPRIFLSYRRAPADHARWGRQVAEDIRGRGYDVILDDFISENDGVVSVPELVANLKLHPLRADHHQRLCTASSNRMASTSINM